MANIGITITIGTKFADGLYSVTPGAVVDPNGAAPDYSTVVTDLATLVADGASPTQGHVTALNTAWGTYKAAADAYTGNAGKLTANATLFFDPAAVTTKNQARAILRELERQLLGRLTEA